jgi:hypothetical protein
VRIAHRFFFVAFLCCCRAAFAQTDWDLTTSDFQSQSVTMGGMDAKNLTVTAGGGAQTIPLSRLLEISQALPPRQPAERLVLIMRNGDRIGGGPVGITGDTLQWQSATFGDLHLPLRQVEGIRLSTDTVSASSLIGAKDDLVSLANGDAVHGIVVDVNAAKVVVQTDTGNTELPLPALSGVTFATIGGNGGEAPPSGFRIHFDDGESMLVASPIVADDQLQFTIAGGPPIAVDLSHVSAIEQVNGPVSWLSSRQPSENVYTPFIGAAQDWPAQMDHSVLGEPIRFKDQTFDHGIGVHAYSRLTWPLDGSWRAFRTQFAVDGDDPAALRADVTVRIKLDDRIVFEQKHVHGGELSPLVTEDLGTAKSLTLEVDFGDRMDTRARLNWIEPALLRSAPAPAAH